MNKFIHYGINPEEFDKTKCFLESQHFPAKPRGGLWACPVDSEFSWYDWCLQENYNIEKLKKHFTFSLKSDSNIIHLKSDDDIEELLWKGIAIYRPNFCGLSINYSKLLDVDYDGVYFHIPEINSKKYYNDLFSIMDVESICIFNPDIISIL